MSILYNHTYLINSSFIWAFLLVQQLSSENASFVYFIILSFILSFHLSPECQQVSAL